MKRNGRLVLLTVGVVSLITGIRPSLAAPVVTFDRDNETSLMSSFPNSQAAFDQFTGSLASFGVETVDLIDTDVPPFGFNPTLTFGGTGITATANGALVQDAPTYQIGTRALLETDTFGPQVNTVFSFTQHITAFGLFVIQGGDEGSPPSQTNNDNPTTFRLRDAVTNLFTDVVVQVGPGWLENNVFFFGVTDTVPFNEVSILETGDLADGMLYDNIVAGYAVPEPGTLLLATLAGTFVLASATRFRRR